MKKFVCTLMGLVALSFANAQSSREIQSLNEILKATDATWTAAENEVTRMNAIEQEKLFGLLPAVGEMSLLPEETISTEAVRAERFEAAHTPIKNQGSCGSCYSFGASASYEGWKLKAGQTTDLSEQDFMMTAKSIGPHGGCSGWYLDTSMNLLKDKGVANESACPYKAVETACPSSASKVHKIGAWSRTSDLATIKSALANYGPVYTGFAVYGDFTQGFDRPSGLMISLRYLFADPWLLCLWLTRVWRLPASFCFWVWLVLAWVTACVPTR